MDGVASSHLGLLSRICRSPRFWGCGNPDQPPRSPALGKEDGPPRYPAPDVSPADPCNKVEPELLFQGSREETSNRVPLPPHCARDFLNGGALGALQHRDDRRLL